MEIQPLEPSDISSIADLQPEDWKDIIPAIDLYVHSAFCFPIKISLDKKIIGIGAAIIHNKVAWLAHIIVHHDHRNKGLGKLITDTLIDISGKKNCNTLYLLATSLGEPVYRKAGFETETEYLFFKDLKANGKTFASENIVPFSENLKTQISVLDKQVSGEGRMFHLEQHLSTGSVYLKNGIVKGFYLPTFGEGLITATTDQAGHELMKIRMMKREFAGFPADNVSATEFMYRNNFKEYKRAKRMRLGVKRNWQPAYIYNRIGGNLG